MVDACEYHERTKLAPDGIAEVSGPYDPSNEPRPSKRYRDVTKRALPGVRPPQAPTLSVVAESRADPLAGSDQPAPESLDSDTLATLCYAASGVLRATRGPDGGEIRYRAASCTGRLYHVDCYLVCGDLPGLPAGVYHFDPETFALDVLRTGDYRGVLAEATGQQAGVADAPVTVVATSTWWRNAWKYGDRTYRHAFWDSGTVLANLLAAAHALDYRAEVVAGFADAPVTELLGLDPEEEAPLELVPIGAETAVNDTSGAGSTAGGSAAADPPAVEPIDPETEPYSSETVAHPLVSDAWTQSRLADGAAVRSWRDEVLESVGQRPAGDGQRIALDPVDHETASARPLWNTIERRRSCREFTDEPLSRRKLGTVLDRATRGVPGDWNGGVGSGLQFNDAYVLATDVAGVPDGSYQFHPAAAELERVGDVTSDDQTRLALDQEWAGDAHVNVYCTTDVEKVVEELGNRGYRLAQLEAGLVLGRLYLATYAHRDLGGTGLTFFDDRVTDHLSPRAAGQTPTTLFAMGVAGE
ncbi:SagB/ThcOx family dehydrogenase [Halorussus litoreus]|uniref:SagB/ThcOx family dehydrogenase n=1 Tax=Halorussus litoreus TaxID=1710536 RepID=UPI000E263554|nr:SagB/ThcOx family dehydrogenase [Halorussus litoreus]